MVNIEDIQEIVLVSQQGDYALLKVKREKRDLKYSGHHYVAVSLLKNLTTKASKTLIQEGQWMREVLEHLLRVKKRLKSGGVMFTAASKDTITHIQRSWEPRVTRSSKIVLSVGTD